MWLWGCSPCKISSPGSVFYGTKRLQWHPHIQSPTLHSKCMIYKELIKRGSTIDHWRLRCKGWILWPTPYTYIYASCPLHPRKIPGTNFCKRLSWPQGDNVGGRIRQIEKIHLIGTWSRNLLACSIVHQPTILPCVHQFFFFNLVCEAIGTVATPGLLCQPRVVVKQMECRMAGEIEVLGENLPQHHFCPPHQLVAMALKCCSDNKWTFNPDKSDPRIINVSQILYILPVSTLIC
jgi:hypothetical protein